MPRNLGSISIGRIAIGALILAPWTPASAAPDSGALPQTSGELSLHLGLSQANYTSRRFTVDGDITRETPTGELSGELYISKEYIRIDNQPTAINQDRYDANIKWLSLFSHSTSYLYISPPRIRHNKDGYYQSAVALRTGIGRKFTPTPHLHFNLELGTGYRSVWIIDGSELSEPLMTLTTKLNWTISDTVGVSISLVHEQNRRETYRTIQASIKNKITESFGLKYELSYKCDYPFDTTTNGGETVADVGLTYSF